MVLCGAADSILSGLELRFREPRGRLPDKPLMDAVPQHHSSILLARKCDNIAVGCRSSLSWLEVFRGVRH